MRLKIEIKYQVAANKYTTVVMELDQAIVTIGRAEEDLVIRDIKCSRRHALLTEKPSGRLVIYDLGSSNGTFVNGQRVMAHALKKNDVIRMGSTTIKVLSFERSSSRFSGVVVPSVNEYLEDQANSHQIMKEVM